MNMDTENSNCSDEDYDTRKRNLNNQLAEIERSLNKHRNHLESHVPSLQDLTDNPVYARSFRRYKGKQSIFKRPEGPAPRTRKCPISTIPGHHKNPEKWTYYNLEDVPDVSDETVKQSALAFLKDLEERRIAEANNKVKTKLKALQIASSSHNSGERMDCDVDDVLDSNLVFHKPQRKQKESPVSSPKPEFRQNKLIMPDYEFGTKKVQKKKKLTKPSTENCDKSRGKELKLDHLNSYDDEEE